MSRNLGILNYKGGTGKTTTVINLSAGLALRGSRVLCIDLDPQGTLAAQLGVKHNLTLADLFLGEATTQNCIYPARNNLDVLPSSRKLQAVDGALWKMDSATSARKVLAGKLDGIFGNYDFVILDFPPSANKVSENGLMIINEVLIPMPMSHLALVGTYQVTGTIKAINKIPDVQVRLTWIIPTRFDERLRKDRSVLASIEKQFPNQVAPPIRNNVRLAECPTYQETIYEFAPRSNGAHDYAQLVELIVNPPEDEAR
jgi:chromosome partitioning protein